MCTLTPTYSHFYIYPEWCHVVLRMIFLRKNLPLRTRANKFLCLTPAPILQLKYHVIHNKIDLFNNKNNPSHLTSQYASLVASLALAHLAADVDCTCGEHWRIGDFDCISGRAGKLMWRQTKKRYKDFLNLHVFCTTSDAHTHTHHLDDRPYWSSP